MASGQARTAERGLWGGSMSEDQKVMWALLCNLTGEQVAQALTDWHGLQLLDDGFMEHLKTEGYLEAE